MMKVLRKDKVRKNKKSKAAFTLMELLLAITLFSIISVAIYSSMAIGIKLHRRGENISGKYNDIRFAFNRIAKDFRTAIQMNDVFMVSEAKRIYFYSIQTEANGRKEINKISYVWGRDGAHYRLTRLKETYAGAFQAARAEGDELVKGISEIKFDYGYLKKSISGNEEFKWREEWRNEALPKMVRIKIKFKGEELNKIVYCPAGKMGDMKEE